MDGVARVHYRIKCFHSSKEVLKENIYCLRRRQRRGFHSSKEVLKVPTRTKYPLKRRGFHSSKEVLKVSAFIFLMGS